MTGPQATTQHHGLGRSKQRRRRGRALAATIASTCLAVGVLASQAGSPAVAHSRHHHGAFEQVNLVSDLPDIAQLQDPAMTNPWGIAFGPATPLWVNNAGDDAGQSHKIQLYAGATRPDDPIVKQALEIDATSPTAMVFNDDPKAFLIDQGQGPVAARFMFNEISVSADGAPEGRITGWAGAAPPPTVTTPTAAPKAPALPFGLALVPRNERHGPMLLVADTFNGEIDVYNSAFRKITRPGQFVDRRAVRKEMAPYNVTFLKGRVYVSYSGDSGAAVSVFRQDGSLRKRLTSNGPGGRLAEPWGMEIAPKDWGRFGGDLLVGDTGTGMINAFDRHDGDFEGTLNDAHGNPLTNPGLWGLKFGNGVIGTPRTLMFAVGMGNEIGSFEGFYAHGLLGLIKPVGHHHDDGDDGDEGDDD
jgi:uncharacterized protein (TIGR03118 family)